MGYLDYAGLQYLWGKLKEKFAPKSHSHDDRYYTESEMDGKLNSKVDNTETGANGLLSKLSVWTATPTDDTYFMRQDTGGGNSFGRVKFSTLWSYIKGKADGTYQPKGSYAASEHTHDDRYYTEAEIDGKLTEKLHEETITDARDLNTIKTTGVYHLKTTSYTNGPGISNHATIFVDYTVGTPYQIFIPDSVNRAWRRNHVNSNDTWSAWTELKYTDTNTWRGIQNNLTSDSTSDSLSAAQGKALKTLVNGKAASVHTHTKDQVGLGNVDNTADANKSVKYATSAGSASTATKANNADSANALSGLSSRSSQDWGVQTGTFVHGEGDSTGGDFAFRRNCPNAGQLSMVLDGRFYQNEGQYRVLDTSDEPNLNVNSAKTATSATRATTADKADRLTTARTVSGGSDITLSFNYDGSGNSTANIGFYSCKHSVGSTNNYPFHRFAKFDANKYAWVDLSMTFLISQDYAGGGYGVCRLVYRSNADSSSASVTAEWLVRKGLSADTVQVAIKTDKTNGAYCDAFYKSSGGYMGVVIRAIASGGRATSGRTWTLVSSNEADGTTATDKKMSSECWKTIAEAGTALHNQAYSSSASAIDGGYVASAGTADTATSATTSNGVKDYNDANRTIQIGFAGSGLNTSNLNYIAGYTDNGTKIKDVSKDVLTSWIGLGNYLPLSGGTINGQITRSGGGSWISDRNNVAIFGNSYGQAAGNSYNPVVGQKTSDGAWTIGNLAGNENLIFNYTTDSDYNAGSNNATAVYLPAQAGTIITSATIGSQSVNYANSAGSATSAGSVAWGNVSGKPSTFTPASHTHDDKYYTKTEVNTKLDGKSNTGHTHDDRYYTESEVDLKLANYQPKGNYAVVSHTHNYAGSGSSGGSANSAVKLDSSAGSATQPVYFKDGKPVATTYALNKTVPADAKFTDTNTWRGIQNNLTSDSTDQSLSAAQGKALKTLVDGKAPASHTHTKSQITDFPTSMPASDVSAWAKAATKPSYTKAEVGLGNVDNTADKDKSVKYAETAGTAEKAAAADNGIEGFYVSSNSTTPSGCIRFNNGIQICWGKTYSGKTSGSFTYPQSFSLPPCVMISGTGAYRYAFYIKNYTNTSFAYYRDGSGDTASPQYVAIGQWEQS